MIWKILKNLVYCSFIQTGFCFWLLKLFPILLIKIMEMAFLGGSCFSDVSYAEKKKREKKNKRRGRFGPFRVPSLLPGHSSRRAPGAHNRLCPPGIAAERGVGPLSPAPASALPGSRPWQGEASPIHSPRFLSAPPGSPAGRRGAAAGSLTLRGAGASGLAAPGCRRGEAPGARTAFSSSFLFSPVF